VYKHEHVFQNTYIYFHLRRNIRQVKIPDHHTETVVFVNNIIDSQIISKAAIKSVMT